MKVDGTVAAVGNDPLRPAPAASADTVQKTTWSPILVLSLMLLGAGLMRTVFAPLQEAATLDLHLSDFQMGLIQGFAVGFPSALLCLPIAWIIDHGNRIRLLLAMIALCAIGTIGTSFCWSFATLFLARMVAGVGALAAIAIVISLAADLAVKKRRGVAILLMYIGTYIGIAFGFALGGTLVSTFEAHPLTAFGGLAPWRQTHLVIGLVGALGLIPLLFLKEPKRHEVEQASAALRPTLLALWSRRAFLIPFFIGQVGVTLADTAAGIWASPILIRNFHLKPEEFSSWIGGLLFLGGVLGALLGAISADLGQKSRRRGGILLGAVVAAAIGIPGALFPIMPTVGGFGLMLGVLLVCGGIIGLTASTVVTVLIPNEERGICMAIYGIVNSLFGMGIAPTLVTFGSWLLGGDQHLALALTITGGLTGVLSLAGYLVAMRNVPAKEAPLVVA